MAYVWLHEPALYDTFPDGTFLTDASTAHYLDQTAHAHVRQTT